MTSINSNYNTDSINNTVRASLNNDCMTNRNDERQ